MEERGSTGCPHHRTDVLNMNGDGVAVVCKSCGKPLDLRPRKEATRRMGPERGTQKKLFPEMESDRLPVQRSVREAGGEVEERKPSGVTPLVHEPDASGTCSRHGGPLAECDQGPGKANCCTNSMWGDEGRKRGAFGPCRCLPCHNWHLKVDYSLRERNRGKG